MYDKLVASNQTTQAHEIVKNFKNRYQDLLFFDTIPSVKEFIAKDKKIWIQHVTSLDDMR